MTDFYLFDALFKGIPRLSANPLMHSTIPLNLEGARQLALASYCPRIGQSSIFSEGQTERFSHKRASIQQQFHPGNIFRENHQNFGNL